MDKVLEGFESFIGAVGPAGYPTTLLGGVLMVFFYLRKQESGVRKEIVLSLQRLQTDKDGLQARIDIMQRELDAKEGEIDALRSQRRTLEDKAYNESRRADGLQQDLQNLKRQMRSQQ